MTERQRITAWVAAALASAAVAAGVLLILRFHPQPPVLLTGVVLLADSDPAKQVPIADAEITAAAASLTVSGRSDLSGLFRLMLPAKARGAKLAITVRRSGYQPVLLRQTADGEIVIARMPSSAPVKTAREKSVETVIGNVRIRYSGKSTMTTNIGFVANTFEVRNRSNVPCSATPPCSPDNRWRASIGSYSLDAGAGNEFRNIRLSCIAGPCPFTRTRPEDLMQSGRTLHVSVLDWSDTATFLLEAEVSQTRISDVIRESYPAISGSTMSFTLPEAAEGPSIEAEFNGNDIIFPLGPDLILSWANCSIAGSPSQSNLYRCELKAGYRFRDERANLPPG